MYQLCVNSKWLRAARIAMASIIRALPEWDVKNLSADQNISNPVTLLKELIENSVDARATIVEVIVSGDTISKIEVRDNGTGINQADYAHLAKAGHTSKITSFDDLSSFSGISLGFRGQALAIINSIARLFITTKTIDTITATELSFSSDGTIEKKRSIAAPVGTTVTVTNFLKRRPVREKLARKEASKAIHKMKELITSIALAHPQIRFSLKVSNSRSPGWTCPANTTSALKNTIVTLFGAELAGQCVEEKFSASVSEIRSNHSDLLHMAESSCNSKQCHMETSRVSPRHHDIELSSNLPSEHAVIETKYLANVEEDFTSVAGKEPCGARYTFEAFMAKPDADPSKIDQGIFISADSRPLSSARGTPKKLAALYRDTLHKLFGTDTRTLKEPFLRLNIKCPVGSYDPNVDSSKEEVIFSSESDIVNLFSKFCEKVYGKTLQVKLAKEKHEKFRINRESHSDSLGVNTSPPEKGPHHAIYPLAGISETKTDNSLVANENSPRPIKKFPMSPSLLGKDTTLGQTDRPRPDTPQTTHQMHNYMEHSLCDDSEPVSKMPPSRASPPYPSLNREPQENTRRCVGQVNVPGGKYQDPTIRKQGKGLVRTLVNASADQKKAEKRTPDLQTPPHSIQRPGPTSGASASFQPVSQAFRNVISDYLEETRSKRQREEDALIKHGKFQSVSSGNVRIEKHSKIRMLEKQPEQTQRHVTFPFRPVFEGSKPLTSAVSHSVQITIANDGLLKRPNAPHRPSLGVHPHILSKKLPMTRIQAQGRDTQLEIPNYAQLCSPSMDQNLHAGIIETKLTGLAVQDNRSSLIKAQKMIDQGAQLPNVPAQFLPLEKIPRSLWFRGKSEEGSWVGLDVQILSSPDALTSMWKLCLGDNYGAEEGAEVEESAVFLQIECTNLWEKLVPMIHGHN